MVEAGSVWTQCGMVRRARTGCTESLQYSDGCLDAHMRNISLPRFFDHLCGVFESLRAMAAQVYICLRCLGVRSAFAIFLFLFTSFSRFKNGIGSDAAETSTGYRSAIVASS